MLAKTMTAPLDRIKLFFIIRDREFKYKEMLLDLKYIRNNHGMLNLWRGNLAQLMRVMP